MMQKKAKIVAIDKNIILIELLDLSNLFCISTCSSKKSGCHHLKDNPKLLKTTTLLKSSTQMNIKAGDFVTISISHSKQIFLKFLLYGLPLSIALLGYKISLQIPEIHRWTTNRGDNWIAIFVATVSFISSFYILSLFNRCLFRFINVRILHRHKNS